MLARITKAEARIAALEQQGSALPPDGTVAPDRNDQLLWCPDIHTAAAYKMINCWPRLRL